MKALTLFLPCAAGVEDFLADEVHGLTELSGDDLMLLRGGVRVRADWPTALRLNLMSRLAQRVLIEVAHAPYRDEHDLYRLARGVAWETWFTVRRTFRVDLTAQASPLHSLNFAALRVKDALADRFRDVTGERPSVDTRTPHVRVQAHLTASHATLYIDTSGEPLFKRGWRHDKGDAPLKETLAAAMLAACGWWQPAERRTSAAPLYDPCCGSGTIVIEAAQLALGIAPGGQRHFGFEHLLAFRVDEWLAIKKEAKYQEIASTDSIRIFGSDVAHRMVDFAQRNAQRAGVAAALQLRGGDALQRLPPTPQPGVLLLNPPYGERIAVAGVAGSAPHRERPGRERFVRTDTNTDAGTNANEPDTGDAFFARLAAHWKTHYADWTAWLLTPDRHLSARLRLSVTRRVPLWNGPIECRLMRFDIAPRQNPGHD